MKKWGYIWLALSCFAFNANAQECGYPEECCWKPIQHGCYELGADLLYWKPCVSDLEFAAKRTDELKTDDTDCVYLDSEGVCPCWEPGVRVFFDYPDLFNWCNIGLRLSWTFIEVESSSSHGPGSYLSPLLHPGFTDQTLTNMNIKGEYDAIYNEWEALFYYNCSCNMCTYITPYIGVAGLVLKQDFDVDMTFDGGTAEVEWSSDYNGVGLRAGLDFVYDHSPCLSFFGFANGSILAGEHCAKNHQEFFASENTVLVQKDPDCCLLVPGYHIGVGARANLCICGWDFAIRGGYEFLQWHNLPKHKVFVGDNLVNAAGKACSGSRTLGFHGPFLGMILYF